MDSDTNDPTASLCSLERVVRPVDGIEVNAADHT